MSDEDYLVVGAMEHYGGAFVQALAMACHRADANNLAKIKTTWADYWESYRLIATQLKEVREKEKKA